MIEFNQDHRAMDPEVKYAVFLHAAHPGEVGFLEMPSPLSFAVTYLYGEFPYLWIAVEKSRRSLSNLILPLTVSISFRKINFSRERRWSRHD
ncbi:MAG: hypothetical protein AUH87_00455 [Deltaproteobacteria bacterium 13_1_40CM_4_54_4]|nr:MAG: hypothetical protein AUH87_00455 [Deltaproteobacteria bacterium 13_1_40CM_4_54_4]